MIEHPSSIMQLLKSLLLSIIFGACTIAQNTSTPVPPTMTLLYSMEALLGDRFSLGPVPNGQERIVIPIIGGSFKGPRMSGKLVTTPASYSSFDE
jgi:hypothetical protein